MLSFLVRVAPDGYSNEVRERREVLSRSPASLHEHALRGQFLSLQSPKPGLLRALSLHLLHSGFPVQVTPAPTPTSHPGRKIWSGDGRGAPLVTLLVLGGCPAGKPFPGTRANKCSHTASPGNPMEASGILDGRPCGRPPHCSPFRGVIVKPSTGSAG